MTDKILLVIMRLQKDFERGFAFVVPEDRVKKREKQKKGANDEEKDSLGRTRMGMRRNSVFLNACGRRRVRHIKRDCRRDERRGNAVYQLVANGPLYSGRFNCRLPCFLRGNVFYQRQKQ